MKRKQNQSLNLNILTPEERNNPGIVRSLSEIGWSVTMTKSTGSTPDTTAGGAVYTSGEGSTNIDNTGSNTTEKNPAMIQKLTYEQETRMDKLQ